MFSGELINNFAKMRLLNKFKSNRVFIILTLSCILFSSMKLNSQTMTITPGSYIINMGITPQTVGNGLKPYGMVYDLIKNYNVSIVWSIEPTKPKDGIDFSHNGINYKGGTFIIPSEFRSVAVNNRITYWQSQGVIGATTVSPFTVPIFNMYNIRNVPRWTLDKKNGSIAAEYFVNAGIPPSAHGGSSESSWKNPDMLDCCDDLFVMPHADPIWSTHQRLFTWNLDCKGAIWAACHAVSALENMVNPANRSIQTNFLTQKDPAFTGTSGNYANSNSLILWGDHKDGSPPYTHRLPAEPINQYMDIMDGAQLNGSEQIYIPRQSSGTTARWNPGAKILLYDPTQENVLSPNLTDFRNVAATMVFGKGFDDNNRGFVMYEAGHSHNKSQNPENIAAQRAFFNFGFLNSKDKFVTADLSSVPTTLTSGTNYSFTYTLPVGVNQADYTTQWSSSCGGSYSPSSTQQSVTFTPPIVTSITQCIISVAVTDLCGRT